jgi:predicted transcriptional regulator
MTLQAPAVVKRDRDTWLDRAPEDAKRRVKCEPVSAVGGGFTVGEGNFITEIQQMNSETENLGELELLSKAVEVPHNGPCLQLFSSLKDPQALDKSHTQMEGTVTTLMIAINERNKGMGPQLAATLTDLVSTMSQFTCKPKKKKTRNLPSDMEAMFSKIGVLQQKNAESKSSKVCKRSYHDVVKDCCNLFYNTEFEPGQRNREQKLEALAKVLSNGLKNRGDQSEKFTVAELYDACLSPENMMDGAHEPVEGIFHGLHGWFDTGVGTLMNPLMAMDEAGGNILQKTIDRQRFEKTKPPSQVDFDEAKVRIHQGLVIEKVIEKMVTEVEQQHASHEEQQQHQQLALEDGTEEAGSNAALIRFVNSGKATRGFKAKLAAHLEVEPSMVSQYIRTDRTMKRIPPKKQGSVAEFMRSWKPEAKAEVAEKKKRAKPQKETTEENSTINLCSTEAIDSRLSGCSAHTTATYTAVLACPHAFSAEVGRRRKLALEIMSKADSESQKTVYSESDRRTVKKYFDDLIGLRKKHEEGICELPQPEPDSDSESDSESDSDSAGSELVVV